MERFLNRPYHQVRNMRLHTESFGYADGSVFFEMGNTKVLVTVSLLNQIPPFLKNKKQWWLTGTYSLLPHATHVRTERETAQKRNDRSIEISRLIGRVLRSVVTLDRKDQEKTIQVDCDVLQADGGTRTACITAASVALLLAQQKWIERGEIKRPIIHDVIVGVSAGLLHNLVHVDLDYAEDSNAQADVNFIFTRSGDVIEIQGCAEKKPLAWQTFMEMRDIAYKGAQSIFDFLDVQQHIPMLHSSDTSRSIKSI